MKHLRKYIKEVLENNNTFNNIIDAIHSYTSLSQDVSSLRKLLGTPDLKNFMLKTQEQIHTENIWASRKLNFRDQYIADPWYIKEGRGQEINLKGPISFYYGEPPTEFAANRYTLRLKIPKEKIIFHSLYNKNYGFASEREILTEGMTIIVTSIQLEDDWEGNIVGAYVTGKVIK